MLLLSHVCYVTLNYLPYFSKVLASVYPYESRKKPLRLFVRGINAFKFIVKLSAPSPLRQFNLPCDGSYLSKGQIGFPKRCMDDKLFCVIYQIKTLIFRLEMR